MQKLLVSKKGMTLIEVIISLAVLGIVSSPLLVVFTNAQIIIGKTESRIEINAVMRIIKENVTNSVKYGGFNTIKSYTEPDEADLMTDKHGRNLEVKSKDGQINGTYMFDANRTMDFGEISGAKNTCEYEIILKKMNGSEVQKLKMLVNSIDPVYKN